MNHERKYQILNGDSLKEQFPSKIKGDIIIARECLVDGDVSGNTLEELFKTRAKFLSTHYEEITEQDYYEQTVPEIEKILSIPNQSEINLWFEDDLFCQVNFWFVLDLLNPTSQNNKYYLIRPSSQDQFGFGGFNEDSLQELYEQRIELNQLETLSSLWTAYKTNNFAQLRSLAIELQTTYPFILKAVESHFARIPSNGKLGRPSESIIQIMKDLDTNDFATVFKEFNTRESIYGFGDLQVKRLFDRLLK